MCARRDGGSNKWVLTLDHHKLWNKSLPGWMTNHVIRNIRNPLCWRAVWSRLAAFAPHSPPAPRLHLADCWLRGTKAGLEFLHHCAYCLTSNSQPVMLRKQIRGKPAVNNQRCQHPTLSSHPSKVFPTLLENPGHGTICHKGQGALWRIKTHRYNENLDDNYATSSIMAFGFWYPSYPINFQVSSINRWAIIETSLYECKVVVSRYKIKHKF